VTARRRQQAAELPGWWTRSRVADWFPEGEWEQMLAAAEATGDAAAALALVPMDAIYRACDALEAFHPGGSDDPIGPDGMPELQMPGLALPGEEDGTETPVPWPVAYLAQQAAWQQAAWQQRAGAPGSGGTPPGTPALS
jgi:hypothetical protein